MDKLWQKGWKLSDTVEAFETRDDLTFDHKLLPYDVLGSIAHAAGLAKVGILSNSEFERTRKGLLAILARWHQGKFKLKFGDEDIHTKIEHHLTAHGGSIGKKIHTGRSRNDQVLTALRLYVKDALLGIDTAVLELAAVCATFAQRYEFLPMPGYTHMQRAMPSSVGMWAGNFAEALLDDLMLLRASYDLIDCSPLGSAAGYGVPISLPRDFTAKLLGFARLQNNSLYCQNSRAKFEAAILSALVLTCSPTCPRS